MKGLLLAAAVLANTIAAPQLRLTKKSYAGLEHALAGRIPVGIYSANRIYQAYEDNENNVVVLNFPGLGSDYRLGLVSAAPSLPTSAAREAPIARTRTAPADVVAPSLTGPADVVAPSLTSVAVEGTVADLTPNPAVDAVVGSLALQEDVADALEDAVEDAVEATLPAAAVRTLVVDLDDLVDSLEISAEDPAAEAAEEAAEAAEEAAEDAAEAAVAAALGIRTVSLEDDRTDEVADALEDALEDAAEAAEDAAEAAEDAAEDAAEAEIAAALRRTGVPAAVAEELADEAADDIVRRKRQDDDDDDDDIFGSITTADRVSFALSGLGTILGINLGRWLDTTHEANVKLIDGMENVGTIVLDQVDNILERANDPNRTKSDKFNLF